MFVQRHATVVKAGERTRKKITSGGKKYVKRRERKITAREGEKNYILS